MSSLGVRTWSRIIFYYSREVKPPALNMRLTGQTRNCACCHGAERSLWCCAAPAGRAGEGAAAQGKLPNRSSSHSSSFAVLPNTQIHHSPTRARAMLLQVPGMRPTQDVMSVPETGHAKGRVQRGSHSIHIFLTIVKVQMGKRRVVGSQGDMKSKRKK